jgi:hypothetical protein
MHSMDKRFRSNLLVLTLALMLLTLWFVVLGYQGFVGDAQIYAFQALARIHTALSTDLYLQGPSQDRFTVFSPFYASFVTWFGLDEAARLLTLFLTTMFFIAAWNLAAAMTNRSKAWLAVLCLIVVSADYGGSGVFRLSEQYLTARLPAQALIIAAFAFHARGMRSVAMLIAVVASIIHPIMAFPGLLLLACISLPFRVILSGAILGLVLALAIALSAAGLPALAHLFVVMDKDWLGVVTERSQFLFPKLWSVHDWDTNLRPLAYLVFISAALGDERVYKFCITALLVGSAGLAVALIADLVQPVAILVQGQAWRWVWIACLISVLLLPATILRVWNDKKCGQFCAVLLLVGWIIPMGGTACVFLAVTLWSLRRHISHRAIPYLRCMAIIIAVTAVAWADTSYWTAITSRLASRHAETAFNDITGLMAVKVSAAAIFVLLWWWLRNARKPWAPISVCAALLASLTLIIPASFKQTRFVRSEADINEFFDWRAAIPETSTVFVAPTRDVGTFVWFTLERPNYLALDQSAGVVFSRQTALEVRRRSEVLLPLTEPTWKILSKNRSAGNLPGNAPTRPVTPQTLTQVCGDPRLGFVISPENVGFDPLRHEHVGAWKDWNLYDCAHVRSHTEPKGST